MAHKNQTSGLVRLLNQTLINVTGSLLTMDPERERYINIAYFDVEFKSFAYQKHVKYSGTAFIEVFEVVYWLSFIALISLLSLSMVAILFVSSKQDNICELLPSTLMFTFGTSLNMDQRDLIPHTIPHKKVPLRVLMFATVIFCFMNLTMYSSGLLSHLLTKRYVQLDGLEDLLDTSYY